MYKRQHLFPFIYELDSRKEWVREDCWIKANPGLGTIKNKDTLRDKVRKAQENPLLVKNLVCKEFNIRETSSESWLNFEDIDNNALFDIAELKPRYGCLLYTSTDKGNGKMAEESRIYDKRI